MKGLALDGQQVLLRQNPQRFVRLHTPTVWEAVSNMIHYRGAIYLVGSKLYVNHNSADVYRYDPRRDAMRYETHLFSQDAGKPAIFRGLLFYPAEDSRFSAGVGEYYVTDGVEWEWHQAHRARAIHFHAFHAHDGRLFAAAAAWNGLLYASRNGLDGWRLIYNHPTSSGRITRINGLSAFQDRLFAGGFSQSLLEHYLFRLDGDTLRPVTAVPRSRWVVLLGDYHGWLYLHLVGGQQRGLYRFDGQHAEKLSLPEDIQLSAGVAHGGSLYLTGHRKGAGIVLRSGDGILFKTVQTLDGREPIDLAISNGRLFLGIRVPGSRGELWVSRNAARQGTLWSRALREPDFRSRLRAFIPDGTGLAYQIAHGDGPFAGPGGAADAYYPWDRAPARSPLGRPYRLKIRFRGDAKRSPYLAWGAQADIESPAPPLPAKRRPRFDPGELEARLQMLESLRALGRFWEIRPFAAELRELGASGAPAVVRWLEGRLKHRYPIGEVGIFGGRNRLRTDRLIRHYLLMGLALSGRGRVPPSLWEAPFDHRPNGPEKFYAPHEAAVFAAGQLRQNDPQTVASLVNLLHRRDLPLWFRGDAVGALTRITGQRFGYDFQRWAAWLEARGGGRQATGGGAGARALKR